VHRIRSLVVVLLLLLFLQRRSDEALDGNIAAGERLVGYDGK
jgi:hypothetical protein